MSRTDEVERMTTPEVRHLRAAFAWEAAVARVDYPRDLLMVVFDRACVTAATRPGKHFGPENPREQTAAPVEGMRE